MTTSGHRARPRRAVLALTALTCLTMLATAVPEAKKVTIKTQHEKTFSFAGLKTWTWHSSGTGEVKVALTPNADPAKLKQIADPVIVAAVERELPPRGFTKAPGPTADIYLTYWLLLTIGQSSQSMGQFLGAVPEWGLPPFTGSTTAMRAFPAGTLLIDVLTADGNLVWRGAAQGEVSLEKTTAERKQRLEQIIHELLQKFPPKK